MHRGLVLKPRSPSDFQFGGITGISDEILRPDGNWEEFLPDFEIQTGDGFDTMACVTFSALNCLEIMARFYQWGMDFGNRSDRFTAKMSGTTIVGNDFTSVADSIRKLHGSVFEIDWPFVDGMTREEYYTTIPLPLQEQAKKFLDMYTVGFEYVWDDPQHLVEALKRGPIQVGIYAYGPSVNGLYQRTDKKGNHAITLVSCVEGERWRAFDSEKKQIINLAWDTLFWGALRYSITLKASQPMPSLNLPNNTLVQLTEGTGGFGLYVSGKLYIDQLDKIMASWIVRNNGDIKGKVAAVTLKDWNSWKHFNLKNEPI